jgi:myo-inositol 2-dehydrogenase/D-chiro-inositol 1-dehydrogenase
MVRLGFIGLGGMGLYQARAFARVKGCRVSAGADVSGKSRDDFQQGFPGALVYDSHRRMLAEGRIDAVVIAVPTGLHREVAADALKAGIPVLLEKPMARTVADCHRLIDLSGRTGTLLMIAHCRRYDPYWGILAREIGANRLGAPVLWRDVSAGMGPGRWFMDEKLGGGPLIDGAVHNYDFANLMFGDPESVVSSAIKLDPGVTAVDTGSAVVRYRSGHQLLMSWSWAARGCRLHDLVGPKGFLQFGTGNLTPPEEEKGIYSYVCLTNAKNEQRLLKAKREPNMYLIQGKHFLDCVHGRTKCRTPGTEAVKAVAVAEAILKAGPSGKAREVRW